MSSRPQSLTAVFAAFILTVTPIIPTSRFGDEAHAAIPFALPAAEGILLTALAVGVGATMLAQRLAQGAPPAEAIEAATEAAREAVHGASKQVDLAVAAALAPITERLVHAWMASYIQYTPWGQAIPPPDSSFLVGMNAAFESLFLQFGVSTTQDFSSPNSQQQLAALAKNALFVDAFERLIAHYNGRLQRMLPLALQEQLSRIGSCFRDPNFWRTAAGSIGHGAYPALWGMLFVTFLNESEKPQSTSESIVTGAAIVISALNFLGTLAKKNVGKAVFLGGKTLECLALRGGAQLSDDEQELASKGLSYLGYDAILGILLALVTENAKHSPRTQP